MNSNNPIMKQSTYSYEQATGPVSIKLTNDILFHFLLQESEQVLRGLICALLHLEPSTLHEVRVMNPIQIGSSITSKNLELDILVKFNNGTLLNLEMQVINEHNWAERSISYTSRLLDNLETGDSYRKLTPVIHIGILDYTLFPQYPEFYATYRLMNEKKHYVFTDKLQIGVLSLNQIELATKEDKAYGIDKWAALFKARSWEDLKMLAEKNDTFKEATEKIYNFLQSDNFRKFCEEDEKRRLNDIKERIAELEEEVEKQKEEVEKQAEENERLRAEIRRLQEKNS